MTKIGEIYKIDATNEVRYFQYVARDNSQLGSDVIAVFNKTDSDNTDTKTLVDMLPQTGVDFFTHTTVLAGVKLKLWHKIGYSKVVANFNDAWFIGYDYTGVDDIQIYMWSNDHKWVAWQINKPFKRIGGDVHKYYGAEPGSAFAPRNIIYRIDHGEYEGGHDDCKPIPKYSNNGSIWHVIKKRLTPSKNKTISTPEDDTFSSEQAVILSYDTNEVFGSKKDLAKMYELEDKIESILSKDNIGIMDGHDIGENQVIIYTYGKSADTIFNAIESTLNNYYIKPIIVKIRYGEAMEKDVKQIIKIIN
jgi:hypothetical protein